MNSLTANQVAQFKHDGFLSSIPLLDDAECKECLQGLARLEAFIGAPLSSMDHMKWRAKPYITMPWALRLTTDPRLLDIVEDLLGPDLLLFTSTFFVKEANSASWADWHQDSTYHGYDPVEHVNCWIALTDATEEAGCMEMLPAGGALRQMQHETHAVENTLNRSGQRIVEPLDEDRAVPTPLKAGEFSIHHGLCPHRSGPNRANYRRIGLGINYIPAYLTPTGSFAMSMMLVRGEDRWNHFGTVERPVAELDEQAIAEHERVVTLYRDTYLEQESLHAPLFDRE